MRVFAAFFERKHQRLESLRELGSVKLVMLFLSNVELRLSRAKMAIVFVSILTFKLQRYENVAP